MPRAAAAWLPEPADPLLPLTLDAYLRANVAPAGIDLGSCVRVSRLGDWHRDRSQEGVVIEVVAPGAGVRSARVVDYQPGRSSRSCVTRYVVQCWERRVLRRAVELELVCR